MKPALLLLAALPLLAAETPGAFVAALNRLGEPSESVAAALFTPGADAAEIARLTRILRSNAAAAHEIWSERTRPTIAVHATRMLAPDLAVVDAVNSSYGAMMFHHEPLLFVLQKVKSEWKIAVFRSGKL